MNAVSKFFKITGKMITSTKIWRMNKISTTGVDCPTCLINEVIRTEINETSRTISEPLTLPGNVSQRR